MTWTDVIISVVSVVLTAVASWGVAKLTEFINSKISNTQAANLLTSAVDTVTSVVKEVYQTYVSSMKGSELWDTDAQKAALSSAVAKAKTLISTEAQEYITEHFSDFETWLTTTIESTIYTLKYNATTTETVEVSYDVEAETEVEATEEVEATVDVEA